jgi:glycosyltransferase involved in cell wall biosynthesis
VYNGEKFLASSINSILNQSFKDFEFIIVNDGSSDGSLAIIKEYAQHDPRIYIISRENKGLTASLNEGIATANGKWVARMDADDISLPDRFERQIAWLDKTQADMCGGAIQLIGTWPQRVRKGYETSDAIHLKLLFGSAFAHPTVMICSRIAKANLYSEDAHYVEDYELWTRLSKLGLKMTNFPGVVLHYRIHPEQVTEIRQKQQRVNMVNIFEKYSTSFLNDDLAGCSAYLLIADKQLHVDLKSFYLATEFLSRLIKFYGDPEHIISTVAFSFLTRCGLINPVKVMKEAERFQIGVFKKIILLFLSSLRIEPGSRIYQLLYKAR